ncbi:MAG: SDR family oxidoreductase [Propioniciclava sp.]
MMRSHPVQKILVVGGHGKIALLLAPLLAARGLTVRSVIRNPDHAAEVAAGGAEPIVADVEALDVASLTSLLAGHDAVVWSAGAGGGNPARTYAVDRDAAIRTMQAAQAAGVRRFVMVSYFGAAADHGIASDDPFFAYAEAKAAADDHLRATDLDWTILGPSRLTLEPPTGQIEVGGVSGTVSRADVAAVVDETLQQPATLGQTIRFNTGSVPISEAISPG